MAQTTVVREYVFNGYWQTRFYRETGICAKVLLTKDMGGVSPP